jgi:hypothetical protein
MDYHIGMEVKIIECLTDADVKRFKNLGKQIEADLQNLNITARCVRAKDLPTFVKEVNAVRAGEDAVIVAHANPDLFALPDGTLTPWDNFATSIGGTPLTDRRLFLAACTGGTRTAPARLLFQAGRLRQVVGPYAKARRADVLIATLAYFRGISKGDSLDQIGKAMNAGHAASYRIYDRTWPGSYQEYPATKPVWIDHSSGKAVKRTVEKVKRIGK